MNRPHRILVTGGGTGIGLATVRVLRNSGRDVIAVGRRDGPLNEAKKLGAKTRIFDVRTPAQALFSELGPIDGLVLNAGITRRESVEEWTSEAWQSIFETNVFASARIIDSFVKQLSGPGSIVAVSSTLAESPAPRCAAYAASKAALNALIKNVALELAHRGVRANVVAPGIVETDMSCPSDDAERSIMEGLHPLGRMGKPDEVAETIVSVLDSSWMTGSVVSIDGGLLLGNAPR